MRALVWRGGTGESTVITQQHSASQASRGEWRTSGGTDQGHWGSGLVWALFICVRSLLLGNLGKRFIFSSLKPFECFFFTVGVYYKKKKKNSTKLRVYCELLKGNAQWMNPWVDHLQSMISTNYIFLRTIGHEKGKQETVNRKKNSGFQKRKRPRL